MMLLAKSTPAGLERDAVLWKEMKEGSEFAFKDIFDTYSNLLFQYGQTLTRDRELVKDSVQELFITIWSSRRSLGDAKSVKYYLFFSLRRIIIKKLGKTKALFAISSFSEGFLTVEGHDQLISRKEARVNNQLLVSAAIKTLPARQKEIIFLRYYQELRYDEIERIMNLNNQVVRNTLCKALSNLRKAIRRREVDTHSWVLLAILAQYFLTY